jgi:ribosomal protein L11 methyltransferase
LSSSHRELNASAEYVSLSAELSQNDAEQAEMVFHESGALGLEVQDPGLLPMPGSPLLTAQSARVTAYFDEPKRAAAAEQRLRRLVPSARVSRATVVTEDWANTWKCQLKPVRTGRLWIGQPWDALPVDRIPIVIEPKMAFGTGDHPTTLLCLEAIEEYLQRHPGRDMLDVGTGSGVLAIAARKLGAGRVVGVDNDPIAVAVAKENALANGANQLELANGSVQNVDGCFDLVVANILASTLVELAPALARVTRDRLVLAGVLLGQEQEVTQAQVRRGLTLHNVKRRGGEWLRLDFRRASRLNE